MLTRLAAALLVGMLLSTAYGATFVAPAAAATTGAVYTMTNGSSRNKVMVWSRAADGSLTSIRRVGTGGRGSGGALNNQGGLALAAGWLYAANAGSDTVSVFKVNGAGLSRTDVEQSGGDRPISVAARGALVYVLNAGADGGVAGFRRSTTGALTPIAGSAKPLSGTNVLPVQIGFTRDGTQLVVTERGSHKITRYRVAADGSLTGPMSTNSAGPEPFGFDVAPDGTLIVSEAGNHVEDASSVSSYRFDGSGAPVVVSASAATTETAACWIEITPNGNYAYETNTPDNSITGFAISANGALTRLDANGVTAATGAGSFPIDLHSSSDGKYLYVLTFGTHRILAYAIGANGSLTARPGASGLPGGANGLIAR
ncbi:MAG: beta-propeller fold lactonase family protein [Candidatus Limnocylindrales bacterium]